MSSGSGATSAFKASSQERRANGDDWQSVHFFRSGRTIAEGSKDILGLSERDRNKKAKKQERSIAMKRPTTKEKVDLAKIKIQFSRS